MRPLVSRKSKMDFSIVLGGRGRASFACESLETTCLQEDAAKRKALQSFNDETQKWAPILPRVQ